MNRHERRNLLAAMLAGFLGAMLPMAYGFRSTAITSAQPGSITIPNGGTITFANGSTISGDSGADTIITAGSGQNIDLNTNGGVTVASVNSFGLQTRDGAGNGGFTVYSTNSGKTSFIAKALLDAGATVASGQTLTVENIKGIDGSTLTIAAGDTAGDDIEIRQGGGESDANSVRIAVLGSGPVQLNRRSGATDLQVLTTGGIQSISAHTMASGATVASGQTLTVGNIKGHNGSTLTIAAGDTAGDAVVVAEGAGDGGQTRALFGGTSVIYSGSGTTSWTVQNGSAALNSAVNGLLLGGNPLVYNGSDTFPAGAAGKHHFSGASGSGTCAALSLFYHDGTSWTLVDDGSTCTP